MRLTELSLLVLMACAAGCGDGASGAQPDASDLGGQTAQNTKTASSHSGASGGATVGQSGSAATGAVGSGGTETAAGGATGGASNAGGVNGSGGTQSQVATSASGGQASAGGSTATGGSSTVAASTVVGGTSAGTQPATLLGGSTGIGGSSAAISATGGATTAGAGSSGTTGGTSASSAGGVAVTGGSEATGGIAGTGGAQASGGAAGTGGTRSTGGFAASGGAAAGGASSLGGTATSSSSGGLASTGGAAATGGTSSSACASGIEVNGVCWTCEPAAYNANDRVCDCGCGVHDPDCDDLVGSAPNPYCTDSTLIDCCTTFTRQGSCVPVNNVAPMDALDWNDNSKCMYVPAGWTCDPLNYADLICHCGCGVFDEADCAYSSSNGYVCQVWDTPGACSTNSEIDVLVADDNAVCNTDVPARWTCDRALYGDGTCDCGCGTKDVDCASLAASVCERCDGKGSCAQPNELGCGAIAEANNALCTKAQWTCSLAEPGDGFCDCGCGMEDPDCVLPAHGRAECSRCGMRGSCAKTCQDIDSTDISTCRSD